MGKTTWLRFHEPTRACRSCGKSIWWRKMDSGKMMPIEAEGEHLGESHFAYCKDADSWRKSKTSENKAEQPKEYLIKPLRGKVIMPDDAADQQVKNFIVRYKESVLVKDFLQMIAVANIGGQMFEVHAVEDITVIMEDKENGDSGQAT